jgi:CheY-like chemotaxis protein
MRLLYIDDDRINTLLFVETCKRASQLELRTAACGQEALAVALEWPVDVLVIDLHLPDTDGYALLAMLRAVPGLARVPAFLCSAEDADVVREPARRAGFNGCWTKPVQLAPVLKDLAAVHVKR